MTGPNGNSDFCFPETLNVSPRETLRSTGNKTQCFVILLNSKLENNCEEIFCFIPGSSQICSGFKKHDQITCESKVLAVVSLGR